MKVTLGTNTLLRLATRDHPAQVATALQLLRGALLIPEPSQEQQTPQRCVFIELSKTCSCSSARNSAASMKLASSSRSFTFSRPLAYW